MTNQNSLGTEDITINDLLEAGLHFGHQTKRWNPKMKRFVFDKRNGIFVIDLAKSLNQLKIARQFVYETIACGKRVIFIGTKKISQEIIKEAAQRCGQYYIISRWLGGTLTNYKNIRSSVAHMREIEELEEKGELAAMPQKAASRLRHEMVRLQRNLSGIADMTEMPGALIVIDVNREANAVKEANRMGIPVVGLVDTNSDPDSIDYPIPGNDDATRAVRLIVNCFADTIEKASAEYANAVAEQAEKKKGETKKPTEIVKPAKNASRTREKKERETPGKPRSDSKVSSKPEPSEQLINADKAQPTEKSSSSGSDKSSSALLHTDPKANAKSDESDDSVKSTTKK